MVYGRGFGFRGVSPPWPYIGRGRGGLRRCLAPGAIADYMPRFHGRFRARPYIPYSPWAGQENDLDYLREESSALKKQLEEIESRISELEAGTRQ